ncbi:MAG: biotin/lipoyl-binding protein, partial [Actinobacteria bacterium]|nr:biotin/lipoyl-binding protein [Actinomycetota bacterium]
MYDFKMPSMGADMTSATLVAWNVGLGDRVGKGDILCEIETEKGNI